MSDGTIDFDIRKADEGAVPVIEMMIELMRAAVAPPPDMDPGQVHQWLGMALAAAAATAGIHYGTLAAAGIVANERHDRRKALKIVENNFRSGIEIALRHGARVAADKGMMQ